MILCIALTIQVSGSSLSIVQVFQIRRRKRGTYSRGHTCIVCVLKRSLYMSQHLISYPTEQENATKCYTFPSSVQFHLYTEEKQKKKQITSMNHCSRTCSTHQSYNQYIHLSLSAGHITATHFCHNCNSYSIKMTENYIYKCMYIVLLKHILCFYYLLGKKLLRSLTNNTKHNCHYWTHWGNSKRETRGMEGSLWAQNTNTDWLVWV